MQQAVSYNNAILLKKDLHLLVRWSRVGRIPGSDCLCQMSVDSPPEKIKGLTQASDRSYLFSLWSHQLSYLYQFLSNCFFILTCPLFRQWLCVCSGPATSSKVPLLFSPPLEDKAILHVLCLSFRSEDMKTAMRSFSFSCGVSSSPCDLSELFHPQRAWGSSFMLHLTHDNQIPIS